MATPLDHSYVGVSSVLTLLCVFSADVYAFAGGTGAPDDPFQVATAEHLISIGSDVRLLDMSYRLIADVDLGPDVSDGRVFRQAVIAPDTDSANGFQGVAFGGRFHGAGHAIRRLTVHGGSNSYLALFGALGEYAEVTDLSLIDADVMGEKDGAYVGGLTGTNDGHITGCRVSGNIGGDYGVGAIAGQNTQRGTIVRCSAAGTFQGNGRVQVAGGLVGLNYGRIAKCSVQAFRLASQGFMDCLGGAVGFNSGSISGCYARGEVEGEACLGGLVAENVGSIFSCYAEVDLSSRELSRCLGGLVGSNSGRVFNCYASGTILNAFPEDSMFGGLIGHASESARVINSFWDAEVSAIGVSRGGLGLRTSQMMDPEMYGLNGWGSDPNWVLDGGNDYPRLAWEGADGQLIQTPAIDWFEGNGTTKGPYVIMNPGQLGSIGTASILWEKAFVLMSDLDLIGMDVPRIGIWWGTAFTGVFNGNGRAIRNLTIDQSEMPGASHIGLFGHVGLQGRMDDLAVRDAAVRCGWGAERVGILAGVNEGAIDGCFTSGSVIAGDYSVHLSQLVGYDAGSVTDSSSTATVSAGKDSRNIGGLVGSRSDMGKTERPATDAIVR